MSRIKVYINTFDYTGKYSGFQDISEDVDFKSLGNINQQLEGSDYDVGLFKNSNVSITLRNDHGRYSEPENLRSIFLTKRVDSLVKITWEAADDPPICGVAIAGSAVLSEEETVFYGLLSDTTSSQNIEDQKIKFSVLGLESIFDKVSVNYSDLSSSDLLSVTMYKILNQAPINQLMFVSQSSILPAIDQVPDDISELENKTVSEAIKSLTTATNSVLYITSDLNLIIRERVSAGNVAKTFYGQASLLGLENIVNIKNVKTGINRIVNYLTWDDTTILSSDSVSVSKYGVRKKNVSIDYFTNSTKRTNLLDDIKEEFSTPKMELTLTSKLNYSGIDVESLDKVLIDYPTLYEAREGEELPLYGVAVYGVDRYPAGKWALTISTDKSFKVMGRTINLKNETIDYKLREN